MKYEVMLDGRPASVELDRNSERYGVTFSRNGEPPVRGLASVVQVEPGIYSVLLGGCAYEVKVVPGPAGLYIDLRGHHLAVEIIDPREDRAIAGAAVRHGRESVAAPMPGKVIRLLVNSGDEVQPRQGLIVVEAMKMQNELRAPRQGRVVSLNAKEGDTVSAGQVLVVLE